MGDVIEGWPPVSQDHEVQGMQEEGSMDFQVQAKRHLDEDIENILELAAPGDRNGEGPAETVDQYL